MLSLLACSSSGRFLALPQQQLEASSLAVAGAVDAVVGAASHLFARACGGGAPPPSPALVLLCLLSGGEARLDGATVDTTLAQLQLECERAAGVPPARQRICVQGTCVRVCICGCDTARLGASVRGGVCWDWCCTTPCAACWCATAPSAAAAASTVCPVRPAAELPSDPGLVGLLRSTASHLSSRDRIARSLADWSSFYLLPQGLSRELKGQGLASWLHDHVWRQLRDNEEPPPGTARVREEKRGGGGVREEGRRARESRRASPFALPGT